MSQKTKEGEQEQHRNCGYSGLMDKGLSGAYRPPHPRLRLRWNRSLCIWFFYEGGRPPQTPPKKEGELGFLTIWQVTKALKKCKPCDCVKV